MPDQRLSRDARIRIPAALVLGLIVLVLGLLGFGHYLVESRQIAREKHRMLGAIGELTTRQIQQWREARVREADRSAKSVRILEIVEGLMKTPGNKDLLEQLRERMKSEMRGGEYVDVLIFDRDLRLLASVGNAEAPVSETTKQAVQAAASTSKTGVLSGLFLSPEDEVQIDTASAVRDESGVLLAVLVLRSRADVHFPSSIRSVPEADPTTEVYLVERDGEEALYLTGLRSQEGATLRLRVPLTLTALPDVQAVLGRRGFFEGVDYRGEKVLSDLRQVPDSSWWLVVKLDAGQVLAEARSRAVTFTLVVGLLLLVTASSLAYLFLRRQLRLSRKLLQAEIQKREAEKLEVQVARLSRLHAALSYCNLAIVHSSTAEELLPKICHNVVSYGGLKMVWISMLDKATGLVHPVAASGDGIAYLENIEISTNPDLAIGCGPVGTAIREGREVWITDFQNDPKTLPWRERAAAFGWKSCAVIPLYKAEETVGSLNIYSDQYDAFGEEERKLAVQLAADLSFALDRFVREDERQTLRTAVEQSASAIVITSLSGAIEYVNPAFERISGYTSEEVIGQNPRVLKSGKQPESFYQVLWKTITSGRTWRGQFQNKRKDGTLYWERATISPVHNEGGEIAHFIAIKEDISHQKSLEADLRSALDRAEASNRAKGEFLAVMSHELRTPLNGILGYAELLSYTFLNDEQREFTQTIRTSGEHLLQIVNDILDFSSIEREALRLEVESVLVSELLETSCLPIRKTAADKGIAFHCVAAPEVPERINGDAQRIRQVLINLLGNAVKFTSQGSVCLRVSVGTGEGRPFTEFSVEDTGIGMSPETMARLFQPFVQGDSTLSRTYAGTGLGLAISQRIAKAMGGGIRVTSIPGQGSTFIFRLPCDL